MIWRSVVGKLWFTIIGLVFVVLLVLVLLLTQFLDQFFEQQHERSLTTLSQNLAEMIENYGEGNDLESRRHVIEMAEELVTAYDTQMVVLTSERGGESYEAFTTSRDQAEVPIGQLLKQSDLKKVFAGKEQIVRGMLSIEVEENGETEDVPLFTGDVLAVAEPIHGDDRVIGAVVLYQSLSQLDETARRTKELVFYAALIGIFLSTIFAFFLSSRITLPLVKMKQAADRIIEGDFDNRVPIRTRDEIGALAETFNRMGGQLEESIQALSQEKEQLASVLGSMTDAVITVNAVGHVIITNPPADYLLSIWTDSEEEQEQLHYQPLPKPLEDSFNRVMETEQEYETDLLVHGRTWAVVMTPLYAREQVRGAVAVLRDITEERRTDKLRKDFVANVSHELRTPLAMLRGYSEALVDDIAQSPEDSKELAQIIHDETLRMGRLVNELLDLALMETGAIQIKPEDTVMQQLGQRVVRKFYNLAQEQGVKIEADFPDEPIHSWVDEDSMEQVLTNLVDNAIRHTPENGTVTLEMEEAFDSMIMKVRDTGSGIPAQDLPFIFERFYKADKARKRTGSGTGLGLAIAKHIVEEHGGKISVESREGKGTIFTIRLPNDSER